MNYIFIVSVNSTFVLMLLVIVIPMLNKILSYLNSARSVTERLGPEVEFYASVPCVRNPQSDDAVETPYFMDYEQAMTGCGATVVWESCHCTSTI